MSALLAGVGSRIADRWLQTVVLSGLLWAATLVLATRLGQTHPFATARLRTWLDDLAARPAGPGTAAVLLTGAAVLLTASAAGLAAGALAGLFQRLWGADGTGPLLAALLRRRRWWWRRWHSARARRAIDRALTTTARDPLDPRPHARAERAVRRRQDRTPHRPTRIGDTLHAAAARVRAHYDLDLEPTWPRLWTILPDTLRGDLSDAREAYDSAARLAGWSVLYTALAPLWWPAALIGAGALTTAIPRARTAASVLAALVETAVDLHLPDLAARLGVTPPDGAPLGELGRAVGRRLSAPAGGARWPDGLMA